MNRQSGEVDYLTHCKDIVSSINVSDLSGRTLGNRIGSGSHSTMYELGQIYIPKAIGLSIGIKVNIEPSNDRNANTALRNRFVSELRDVAVMTKRAPSLTPKFPFFMGLLATERSGTLLGILTEDASKGGRYKPRQKHRLNYATQQQLIDGFKDIGGWDAFAYYYEFAYQAAFSVGGQERILDLSPSALQDDKPKGGEDYRAEYGVMRRQVERSIGTLLIKINDKSDLAQSLGALRQQHNHMQQSSTNKPAAHVNSEQSAG